MTKPHADKGVCAFVAAENRRQGREGSFCKCCRVVGNAVRILGVWTEALGKCLDDETLEWSEEDGDFYERFVSVVRAGVYLEGQGIFGDDEHCAAHPKFVECRLTELGRQLLVDQQRDRPSPD